MIFCIHDESGKLNASVKVYNPGDYHERLAALGHNFVTLSGSDPVDPELRFVRDGAVMDRPEIAGRLSKTIIKANDTDTAELAGLPGRCRVVVSAANEILVDEIVTSGGIAITSQVPTTYSIMVEAFPYRRAFFQVEARA